MPRIKSPDHASRNPCYKEQEMTFKCFHDNNFDYEECQKHMENYKNCKKFWGAVQTDRRRKGISPLLPPPEERDQIKQKFLQSQKK